MEEKKHRLSREFYKGEVSIAFTLCLRNLDAGFPPRRIAWGDSLQEPEIVDVFISSLTSIAKKTSCVIPVYCFMPDHQHLIVTGMCGSADVWKTVVHYKQKTGFWMSVNKPGMKWQKDFYDHIIRRESDIVTQVRYILDNPVRKGLVSSWHEYPFKGSIGCKMEDILSRII